MPFPYIQKSYETPLLNVLDHLGTNHSHKRYIEKNTFVFHIPSNVLSLSFFVNERIRSSCCCKGGGLVWIDAAARSDASTENFH